ncbi:farnesyl-diphosphate farnesyltransferase [Phlegmacium glaucopus]|nr:farnesyl-diphosphate farnesyltransferase [Phlegmacium glaucopus]
MAAINWIALLLTHPLEFKTLLQFWLYHEQKRDIAALQEHPTSGWDRKSMQRCWQFLDKTSRSFSAVIKELDGDLARTVALFYLVLRGLDTIEDDMTIPDAVKQPILRSFHIHTVTPGWTYDGCGPNEKDRQLLVEYDKVVEEVNLLTPEYKAIIIDITLKMATGMADYAHKAATTGSIYLATTAEYDLYCHYVAGLVGEGLSRLFSTSGKESPSIGTQLELSNSMGLLLQKTNIIRDYREDVDQQRFFWPREIWGRKEIGFVEMREMMATNPETVKKAMWAQSGMVLDALRHATDALDYLRMLRNQSVFVFCAIPATMAIATLELCFMNPAMFQRNIKIRKAEAAQLIMRSTNPREVGLIFREYARRIHAKAVPTDPSFIRISVACGKIEQWCEHNYPSFVQVYSEGSRTGTQSLNPADPRTRIILHEQSREQQLIAKRLGHDGTTTMNGNAAQSRNISTTELMVYVLGAFGAIIGISCMIVWAVLKYSE